MDLAKHLGTWKERSPEQWARTANRYLPTGGTAILVLAIAYQLASLTWVILRTSGGVTGRVLARLLARRIDVRTALDEAAAFRLTDANVTDAERERVKRLL